MCSHLTSITFSAPFIALTFFKSNHYGHQSCGCLFFPVTWVKVLLAAILVVCTFFFQFLIQRLNWKKFLVIFPFPFFLILYLIFTFLNAHSSFSSISSSNIKHSVECSIQQNTKLEIIWGKGNGGGGVEIRIWCRIYIWLWRRMQYLWPLYIIES